LVLCDLDETRTEAIAAPLRTSELTVEVLATDVSSPEFLSS